MFIMLPRVAETSPIFRKRAIVRGVVVLAAVALTVLSFAQFRGSRGRRGDPDRRDFPTWELDPEVPKDVFTFVRIQYTSYGRYGYRGKWATDWPDADWNMCYRLQQMTSLKVHPDGVVLELSSKDLFNYPFIYIIEPGDMVLTDEEVAALRKYLLNGGFLMVDDFWGEREWANFYEQIKRVFPEREPMELQLEHPIFHAVFDLKEKPQMPSIHSAYPGGPTYERADATEVHYKALFDDKGRMMAIICHNTDLGDGWEREGESEWYFREFSEKKGYPMGINIIFYAMTH